MTTDLPPPPEITTAGGDFYPVGLWVTRPESQSRITNFPFFIGTMIRAFLAIPHFVILYFFQIVASIVFFIATFAILFTGKYPRGLFNFYIGYVRWSTRVGGYISHLYDNYPPFSMDEIAEYPLRYGAQYPEGLSRLLNFPILGQIIKGILLIPHLVVVYLLALVALVVMFIAAFAILFTGRYPAGMHDFVTGVTRWSLRVQAYLLAVTDRYPPFSLK